MTGRKLISFIEYRYDRFAFDAEVPKRIVYDPDMHVPLRIRSIDYMDQDIGKPGFLKRTSESVYKIMRQFVDETDRIREQELCSVGKPAFPRGRIQCRKKLIIGINFRFGKAV